MAEASPVDTALYAFRKREKRFVLTGTAIAYILCSAILAAGLFAAVWPHLSALAGWYIRTLRIVMERGEPSAPPLQDVIALGPWYAIYVVLKLILYAAYEAACLRWMVRGERAGFFGLSLGADTWRVFITYVVWFVLGVVACALVCGLYAGLIALNTAAPSLRIVSILIGALAPLAIVALVLWCAVRLSPAAAASIARRKFAFFDAWGATRGKFWELLGAFVIVLAVYLAVATIASVLIRIPMMQATYPIMSEVMGGADFETIVQRGREALTSPLVAASAGAYVVVAITLALMLYAAWFGVNASVLAPSEPAEAAPAQSQAPAAPAAAPPSQPEAPQQPEAAAAPVAESPPAPTPSPPSA